MIDGLEARLTTLAALGQTLTYGALAAELALDEPGRIAKLTTALETLMEQDAATGQPLRASLVIGRATGGLPARGFFDKARALGYDVTDPIAFHKAQLRACFAQMRP